MQRIVIRLASDEDAQGILEALYSAVHETAARDYTEEIQREWSPPVTPERIDRYRRGLSPTDTTLVAEVNGTIAGYGGIVESNNELRNLYVSAQFGGQGIGSALLHALEKIAKVRGCTELRMDASLTAESFYRRHGYSELARGEHTLSPDCKAHCVRMRKEL